MQTPDLNLLITLDVLLTERSVARAARRLRLSPSAMSRALARLRDTTGDPLLVRAGRGLVPTPRALELRDKVALLVQDAQSVLRPAERPDLRTVTRTFTIRNREGFVENFGIDLIARVKAEAPGLRLCFVQKPDKESTPLRDGSVDLETGVLGDAVGPEVRLQALFDDRFIAVTRRGHPLGRGKITAERFAACDHLNISRRGSANGPIDEALVSLGLERKVAVIVDGYAAALALVRASDLIATVPERYTGNLRTGLQAFALPVPVDGMTVSMFWHPRHDADPVHQWLRHCMRQVCGRRVKAA